MEPPECSGYYWVKTVDSSDWKIAHFADGIWVFCEASDLAYCRTDQIEKIGPYVEPPSSEVEPDESRI